ncbi:MAG: chromosome segregation protein SMC [Clostridiales bacterium]|jgi:chromosome segregation protein|nr:chromosome segregation protein SMC [Clostridiales bacterium]
MYLKRLEMAGFKSFPEKIRLEFNDGVTAVVGPNGSGKSNISDAIRWVLGEQSAKSLRGSKMEDVIFAGTENRKSLGFAEVSMIIDNSSKLLPLDYAEVTVTRRMYRSGEGEYKINGSLCRLKDVHELFMDTGIGREGYSIIGQGRIEEILSARSEDRRMLFEEAAGIVKYKMRRQDACAKLEKEKQNLVRADDVIRELSLQLGPLESQSEKAKKYLELRDELKAVKVSAFLIQIEAYERQLEELCEQSLVLAAQLESEKVKQESLNERYERLKSDEAEEDELSKKAAEKRLEIISSNEVLTVELKVTEEKIRQLQSSEEKLKKQIAKCEKQIWKVSVELEDEVSRTDEAESCLRLKNGELDKLKSLLEELNAAMDEKDQGIDAVNARLLEETEKAAALKGSIQRIEDQLERADEMKEDAQVELARVIDGKGRVFSDAAAQREQFSKVEESSLKLEQSMRALSSELDEVNASLNESYTRAAVALKKLSESESKKKILKDLEADFEGYNKSVKAVLKRKQARPEEFSGICGAVAELLETPKEYETAIEIALGYAMQNIVARTEQDAMAAIEYLKRSRQGRATFLPLTSIKPHDLKSKASLLMEKGVAGVAKDLISFSPEYENVFSNLLGSVIIVDNSINASTLSSKYHSAYKLVTLEGELFSTGGSITGGSVSSQSAGIFTRGRELKELEKDIAASRLESGLAQSEIDSLKSRKQAVNSLIADARIKLQETLLEKNNLSNKCSQLETELDQLGKEELALNAQISQAVQAGVSAREKLGSLRDELDAAEAAIAAVKRQIDEYQFSAASDKSRKDGILREISDLRVGIGGLEEKLSACRQSAQRLGAEMESSRQELSELSKELEENLALRFLKEESLVGIKASLEEGSQALSACLVDQGEIDAQRSKTRSAIEDLEARRRERIEFIGSLSNDISKLEMKIEQVEADNRRLFDEMWDEYKITPQSAKACEPVDKPASQLSREERRLKEAIRGLGDVNVGAIEEHQIVKSRYDFLHAQRMDILEAEEKLKAAIKDLTELMEKQFKEQFALISLNFGVVFRDMFGGGRGELRLTDADSVLESGIDIVAQPPGKNLQSLSLLSGGERALAAMALLFAILRMKPSPFCVLDEIEAALDDANVIRFANYIKRISSSTQFILITHRKGTMEAADVLYGVTMQERGVSKLVSVKLSGQGYEPEARVFA